MTNPYRGLLPDLPAYACTNCGHWQRWPAPGPRVCPVCADVRNALPEDGFEFVTPEQVEEVVEGFCRPTAVEGVTEFGTHPRFGLDSRDRKSTRLNSSHANISYAVFCLKKKTMKYMS